MKTLTMAVPDGEEVTIALTRVNWELLDLTYRYEWDDPEWLGRKKGENENMYNERMKLVQAWHERKQRLLSSIARRVKYESLIGKVVAPGHLGKVTSKSVYDMEPTAGIDPDYEVLSTKPERDVRIVEGTRLILKESDKGL